MILPFGWFQGKHGLMQSSSSLWNMPGGCRSMVRTTGFARAGAWVSFHLWPSLTLLFVHRIHTQAFCERRTDPWEFVGGLFELYLVPARWLTQGNMSGLFETYFVPAVAWNIYSHMQENMSRYLIFFRVRLRRSDHSKAQDARAPK